MVWNTEQTSLYRAVKAHNDRIAPPLTNTEYPEPQCAESDTIPQRSQSGTIFDKLTGDSDMLLLLAVILVLLHEKADKNLIMAVVLIMIM